MFRALCDVPWFNIHKLLKKYNFSFSDIICPWKNEDSFKDESLEPNDFSQYEKEYTNTNRLRGKLKETEISNEDEETTTKNGKCSLCKQEFENYQLLKLHIKCIHSETNCNQCKKEFKTSIKLENHIKRGGNAQTAQAQYCGNRKRLFSGCKSCAPKYRGTSI